MADIRKSLNGTFDRERIARLGWPVAWSGTVSAEEREEDNRRMRELIDEADECFRDSDCIAVEIRDGEIIATVYDRG
jgi:hypothetical protein